jgi:hypothetical protein
VTHWYEDYGEFDEMPDEYLEEEAQKSAEAKSMEVPDVAWKEDIDKIENPDIRKKEIEIAEKSNKKWKAVEEKVDSGEITEVDYFGELICKRWPEERKHTTRCGLESEGLTYDHLGDAAEDLDLSIADAGGNPKPAQMKNEVKKMIHRRGPEASQELADEMLEDGKMSKETHDTISRQVRLHGK